MMRMTAPGMGKGFPFARGRSGLQLATGAAPCYRWVPGLPVPFARGGAGLNPAPWDTSIAACLVDEPVAAPGRVRPPGSHVVACNTRGVPDYRPGDQGAVLFLLGVERWRSTPVLRK